MTNTKIKINFLIVLWMLLTAACQTTPPQDITATTGAEFTLAPNQTATLTDAQLSIKLIGAGSDQRCPSELECAVSGPVSVSILVQGTDGTSTNIDLQTFTDNNGRAPDMQFEGMKDRAEYGDYLIRVVGVLPYPVKSLNEIKASDYRVTLIVTKK